MQVTTELLLNKGRLDFNTAAAVYSASASIGNGYGVAHLDFSDNLRLTTLTNGYTMEANQMTVDTLNLFPDRIKTSFPSCASVKGAADISWQNLKLQKTTEVYLMCGSPLDVDTDPEPEEDCSDYSYKMSHKAECCAAAPTTDRDCYVEKYIYKWQSTSFSMSDTFGSDWLEQTCQKQCWGQGHNDGCAGGGSFFQGVFTSNPNVVVYGTDSCSNLSICSNGRAETCYWNLRNYSCSSSTVGLVLVGLCGYDAPNASVVFGCPQEGSGSSVRWSGAQSAYICTERKEIVDTGWK